MASANRDKPGKDDRAIAELQTTQTGRIGEEAVVTIALLASALGIRIARPITDDHGVDLLAFLDDSPFSLPIQVKTDSGRARGGGLAFVFHLDVIPAARGHYFALCLELDPATGELGPYFWLIPGRAVLRGHRRHGDWLIQVSTSPDWPGKWGPYRHPLRDLAPALRAELDPLDPAPRRRRPVIA